MLGTNDVAGHRVAVERHRHRHAADGVDVLRCAAVAQFQTVLPVQGQLSADTRLYVSVGLHNAAAVFLCCLDDVAIMVYLVIRCSA